VVAADVGVALPPVDPLGDPLVVTDGTEAEALVGTTVVGPEPADEPLPHATRPRTSTGRHRDQRDMPRTLRPWSPRVMIPLDSMIAGVVSGG
jgi:hypothetical protein